MKKILPIILLLCGWLFISCKTVEKEYTITYHTSLSQEQDIPSQKTYLQDYVLHKKDIDFSKEGYELENWYLDSNYSEKVEFPYIVSKNADFYAKWNKIYTLTLMNQDTIYKTFQIKEGDPLPSLENPSLEGHLFVGWFIDKGFSTPFNSKAPLKEDTTLYAKFEAEMLNVTFMDDNKEIKKIEVAYNQATTALEAPKKENMTFKGWSTNKDSYQEFDFTTKIVKNTILYAFYESTIQEKKTVLFKVENETYLSLDVEVNALVSKPVDPTKDGYTFKGWSTNIDFFESFDFASPITNDLTLYAFFDPIIYTITLKDGSDIIKTYEVECNTILNRPTDPVKIGFKFIDWYADALCTTKFDFTKKITSSTTIYAKFEDVTTHTITLFLDGKKHSLLINDQHTVQTLNLPPKEGFEIKDFYLDETYQTLFDKTTPITKDLTLYAKYTKKVFQVTFKNDTNETNQLVEYQDVCQKPNNPNKEGHTFKGWSTNMDSYQEFDFTTPIVNSITLYAFYEIKTFTITFYVETAQYHKATIAFGSTLTFPSTPTKEGYTFKGWSTNMDSYQEFDINTKITTDVSLYAIFEETNLLVTLIDGNQKTTIDAKYLQTISLPTPTKEGYTFKGWSTLKDTYQEFDVNTKITQNVTLYAFYDKIKLSISFVNGNEINKENVFYNETITAPSTPSKEGYKFKGWSTNMDSYQEFDFTSKIKTDVTLYAFFIKEYTITFVIEGTQSTTKVEEGSYVTKPNDPVKEGYSFIGWYDQDIAYDFTKPIFENLTLTAKFEEAFIDITSYSGYSEGMFFEAVKTADLADYTVSYKLSSSSTWIPVDSSLIRLENEKIRCDIVGLAKGKYDVKIAVAEKTRTLTCDVYSYDRSGYAHFNYSTGVGAYQDDGTLKSNAIVVYVTNETKNTVKVGNYTGLVSILQNQAKIGKPLDIRIIGKITTNQYKAKSNAPRLIDNSNLSSDFFTNELETTYGENLVGLTVQYMDKKEQKSHKYVTTKTGLELKSSGKSSYKDTTYSRTDYPNVTGKKVYDDDSYFNMLDIEEASNVTLEGIGTNAEFFQFGLTWKKCKSIEVRNITFTDYTEDACSFEAGNNSDVNTYGHYWIHHNTFNRGKNNWDISGERDKYAGDGGIDVKYINSVTLSYNKFNKCKKTGLVGGDNKNYTKNISFHHNYYSNVESRLPLGRQANMHIYNNYYENCGTCQDIRANAFVFSEKNYFLNCDNPQKCTKDDTYASTIIKSFEDTYVNCKNKSQATQATSRTQSMSGNCKPDGSTDYTNFDTNASLFYYTGSASDVKHLLSSSEVPDFCKQQAGTLKAKPIPIEGGETPDPNPNPDPDPDPQPPVSNTITITFDELTTGSVQSTLTTSTGATVQKGTGTVKVAESTQTILETTVKKCINVGGKGDFTNVSILITTTKKANITVYYSNPGSSGPRYIALFNSSGNIGQDPTGAPAKSAVVNYKFSNIAAGKYAIASAGSGLNIYMIVIDYIE